jgi:hypothetical protein
LPTIVKTVSVAATWRLRRWARRGSLFFVRMVDVVGNASPTLAFLRGIGFGGGSIMVWGGISHGLKSPLIVIAGNLTGIIYRDEILRPVAVPFVQQHHLIFQQDNARLHVAKVCQDFLAAALNWSRVAGAFRRPLTLLLISSHRCSIEDKSGLDGGQSSGLML